MVEKRLKWHVCVHVQSPYTDGPMHMHILVFLPTDMGGASQSPISF